MAEQYPKSLERRLKRVGVALLDAHSLRLACENCGQTWSPNLQPGGRLPRGYWKCPNGCNELPAEVDSYCGNTELTDDVPDRVLEVARLSRRLQ
jgi:hypothetical protein